MVVYFFFCRYVQLYTHGQRNTSKMASWPTIITYKINSTNLVVVQITKWLNGGSKWVWCTQHKWAFCSLQVYKRAMISTSVWTCILKWKRLCAMKGVVTFRHFYIPLTLHQMPKHPYQVFVCLRMHCSWQCVFFTKCLKVFDIWYARTCTWINCMSIVWLVKKKNQQVNSHFRN